MQQLPPVVEREVNGKKYQFRTLLATEAFPIFVRLSAMSSVGMGDLFAAINAKGGPDHHRVAGAIGSIMRTMTPADLDAVVLPLLAEVTHEGLPVGGTDAKGRQFFALHFAGQFGQMFRVLAVAVEVNFADFFGELRDALKSAAQAMIEMVPTEAEPETPPET